jgi:hypothetical protein
MERARLLLVRRELLSAAAPRSCARLVLDSGLPLLVKKVRFCERVVRGTHLHNGELLEEMCEMRDTDAACRGSMATAVCAPIQRRGINWQYSNGKIAAYHRRQGESECCPRLAAELLMLQGLT